jgi:hypothetical protein
VSEPSAAALRSLAEQLRGEETPISTHVVDSPAPPFRDSFVLEAVREGYLLHYGEPRLLAGHDEDLALLAGDYLYALGIRRLAERGDLEAVSRLAELIGSCARLHVEGRGDEAPALWQATATTIGDESAPSQ